jgi:hypothetical protein
LDKTQKAQETRANIDKWNYIRLKNSLHSKEKDEQNKDTIYRMEEKGSIVFM